ncbi:MAG: MFS transporter [Holosporales bacterium]
MTQGVKPANFRQKLSLALGHVVECYDSTIYGFFAVMLAPLFFPPTAGRYGQLAASFGAFAAGFLARPLGAMVFGAIGDKLGRRKALLWSIVLVGIPTLIIGLTPSYNDIGMIATWSVVLARLAQGFFYGAEYAGINLYLCETTERGQRHEATSSMISVGFLGAMLAMALGAVATHPSMPEWGWRVPFVAGGIAAFGVYWLRRNLSESPEFESAHELSENVVRESYRYIWRSIRVFCTAMLLAGMCAAPLYISTVFGNQLLKQGGLSSASILWTNFFIMGVAGLTVFVSGRIFSGSDETSAIKKALLAWISLGGLSFAVLTCPYGWCDLESVTLFGPENFLVALTFMTMITIASQTLTGCVMPYINQLFDVRYRYTSMALAISLGYALLAGTTPNVALWLVNTPVLPTAGKGFVTIFWFWLLPLFALSYGLVTIQSKKTLRIAQHFS